MVAAIEGMYTRLNGRQQGNNAQWQITPGSPQNVNGGINLRRQ
jgi:hypothetical protein